MPQVPWRLRDAVAIEERSLLRSGMTTKKLLRLQELTTEGMQPCQALTMRDNLRAGIGARASHRAWLMASG